MRKSGANGPKHIRGGLKKHKRGHAWGPKNEDNLTQIMKTTYFFIKHFFGTHKTYWWLLQRCEREEGDSSQVPGRDSRKCRKNVTVYCAVLVCKG